MDTLPFELLQDIVDKLSCSKDLFHIRLLNKTFCAVATPRLFQQVTVRSTFTSAAGFSEILQRDTVTHSITAIKFQDVLQIKSPIDVLKREATSDLEVVLESLASSFARTHELPNLKSLTLSFQCLTRFPAMEHLRFQGTILSTISSQSPLPSLTSLNIGGLAAFYHPVYDLPSFGSLFSSLSLTSLSIGVRFHHEVQPRFREPFVSFWEQVFQHRMLGFVSHSLTSLRLHSDTDVSVVPGLDFSQLDFPGLECLSLERILFNEDTHVEDFIIRYKGTLRALSLGECRIAIEDLRQRAPRQWSHIWARFAKEPRELVHFNVLSEEHDYYDLDTNSEDFDNPLDYICSDLNAGYAYKAIATLLPYKDEDERALRALQILVNSRYERGRERRIVDWLWGIG